jgi:hypothetical protein
MNKKIVSMPSLPEAAEELEKILRQPKYDPTKTSEDLARDLAYFAGQAWAVDKLKQMHARYEKGLD